MLEDSAVGLLAVLCCMIMAPNKRLVYRSARKDSAVIHLHENLEAHAAVSLQ